MTGQAEYVDPQVPGVALRPFERRVRQLTEEGVASAEIARRFKRSPETIERVLQMIPLRTEGGTGPRGDVLNHLERRILRWRARGDDHETIGARFLRSGDFVRRVEGFAHHKLQTP